MEYLEDSFVVGDTLTECQKADLSTVQLFTRLGFQVHPESQFILIQ